MGGGGMLKRLRRLRLYILAVCVPMLAVLVPLMLSVIQSGTNFVNSDQLQNLVFDEYQRLSPRPYDPESPVRIVAIDAESIRRIGQWPWPRLRHAEMVERLAKANVAAIGYDVQFSEPDQSSVENLAKNLPASRIKQLIEAELAGAPGNDKVFADAIAGKPVVLGMLMTNAGHVRVPVKTGFAMAGDDARLAASFYPGGDLPLPELVAQAAGVAAQNWLPDKDNIVRRVPLLVNGEGGLIPSLAMETLRVALGASTFVVRSSNASGQSAFGRSSGINAVKLGDLIVATQPLGEITVHYSAQDPRRYVPAWRLFEEGSDLGDLEGKIVFIGASDPLLHDNPPTPLLSAMPGVEVHAQVVEQVLSGASLVRPDWAKGAELAVALLLCLAFIFLLPNVGAFWCGLAGFAAVAAMAGGSWHAFTRQGLLLDPVLPSIWPGAVFLFGILALYGIKRRQESEMRAMFGQFVSPMVVARLAEHPENLKLGGDQRVMTLMFCDIRAFTTISEGKSAQELTRFLNEYLTPLTDVVLDHLGTVDKYMGDAIMAFWNAPLDDGNHAANAADAALAMRGRLAQLNLNWQAEAEKAGKPHRTVRFGVGLNTGEACVGNIGSTRRLNYSVIGDEVNIASRLEGASKYFGVDILCSEATQALATDLAWLEIDRVVLKGKTRPVSVFTLAGGREYARSQQFLAQKTHHAVMLSAYRARRFGDAADAARRARDVSPDEIQRLYQFHLDRFAAFARQDLPAEWEAVIVLDEK